MAVVDRLTKVNKLLTVEISNIIRQELDFPAGALVSVLGAEVSRTLEHALIKISVLPANLAQEALDVIVENIGEIQSVLNKRLKMRKIPKIRFEIDDTEERAGHIEDLLQHIEK